MVAPSQFGALPLPVPVATGGATVSDPGLDVLLAFAAAVLRARCGTAYADIAPGVEGPATPAVRLVRAHNPGELVFLEKQLPALFGYRVGGDVETIADDYDVETARLTLLWIFPPAQADNQRQRGPLVNGIAKTLAASLKRGRDPSWIATGDTEPQATRNGSFLWSWAGLWSFDRLAWKTHELQVEKGETRATYPAVQWDVTVRERVRLGLPTDDNALTTTIEADPDPGDGPLVTFELPLV